MTPRPQISLRPVTDGDHDFILELFHETSRETMESLPLPPEQKRQLLSMQLNARESGWRQANPDGNFQVVVVDGTAAGLWYTDETGEQITLIYAALLERFRGRGVISLLTRRLMSRADKWGKPLCAHVEVNNPAREIWLHLGFRTVSEDVVYQQLEYRAVPK